MSGVSADRPDVPGPLRRLLTPGVAQVAWSTIWLVFLVPTFVESVQHRRWWGVAAMLAFSVVYVGAWAVWQRGDWSVIVRGVHVPSLALALLAAALALLTITQVGQAGYYMFIYVAIMLVVRMPLRVAVPAVLAVVAGGEIASRALPGWEPDSWASLLIVMLSAMAGGVRLGIERREAQDGAAIDRHRLELADQRNRMARDVHDILGHSLTVITVKAELAGRLLDADTPDGRDRARAEVADLESLSRQALADIRRTVEGYREVSLPTELAAARLAAQAAGIGLKIVGSADDVPVDLRDVLAWTVREGVTNVVRHAGARRCLITIGPRGLSIADDGRGPGDAPDGAGIGAGRGVDGLAQRALAAGVTLTTGRSPLGGFEIRVEA